MEFPKQPSVKENDIKERPTRCCLCKEHENVISFLSSFSSFAQGRNRQGWYCTNCHIAFGFNFLGREYYRKYMQPLDKWTWQQFWKEIKVAWQGRAFVYAESKVGRSGYIPFAKAEYTTCKGTNCACTNGYDHSPECRRQHDALLQG